MSSQRGYPNKTARALRAAMDVMDGSRARANKRFAATLDTFQAQIAELAGERLAEYRADLRSRVQKTRAMLLRMYGRR